MKKTLFTFTLLFLFLTTQAQWVQTSLGGSADITEHNGKLFALTSTQKLVVSSDNGSSWTDITTDTLSGRQDFVVSAGNRLYVATYNNGNAHGLVYYSIDEGASWSLDTAGMPNALFQPPGKGDVRKFFVYNGDQLVANFGGIDAYCTKKITDASWTIMPDLASVDPGHYITRGDTLLAIGSGITLKYSTNFGQSFTDITAAGLPSYYVPKSVHLSDAGRIYMATDLPIQGRTALYYSDDFGSNWDSLNIFGYVGTTFTGQRQTLTAVYSHGNTVYMALYNDKSNTTADIFRSDDAGQSFAKDTVGLKVDNFFTEQVLKFYQNAGRLFSVHSNTDIHYKSISSSPIGMAEHALSEVKVFPNPTNGVVHFSAAVKRLSVYGMDGKLFFEQPEVSSALDLGELPKGIYVLHFTGADGFLHQQQLYVY